MKDLLPYQQRVIDEKNELDDRLQALQNFIKLDNINFSNLSLEECELLIAQCDVMREYSLILEKRIAFFRV